MKIILSGLTLAGAVAALLGTLASPSSALPILHPQTSMSVSYRHYGYRHDRRYRRHHRRGGLTIHL